MKKLYVAGFGLLMSVAGACGSNSVVHVVGDGPDGGLGTGDGGIASGDGQASVDGSTGSDGGAPGTGLTTDVKIIIEPNGNDASELVAAINGATKSVHMVMYLLSSTPVEDALVARHNAGVDVKVMLNQTFPAGGSNAAIYASLQTKHVPVQWAPITLTHEKCVIIDGAVAWIMTMNTTQSSPSANREYLAIDKDLDDVVEAEAIFEADYANKSPASVVGKLLVAPLNARERLIGLVNAATSTLDIEGEEFSDVQLTQAITARADAGVKVRLVLANVAPTAAQTTAIAALKQHKALVVSVANPYIHAKAMVADGREMYVGSANFTGGSLGYNRELGIITATASEVTAVASTIAQDFASGTPL